MGTKLIYPLLADGYQWNLTEKIRLKIGERPKYSDTANQTSLTFEADLTQQQIDDVNAIVGDGSGAKDSIEFVTVNNKYIVKDIYDWRDQLETDAGFNIAISFRSSGIHGSNVFDEIVLQPTDPTYQAEKILTNPEKNALETAVANLGRWE